MFSLSASSTILIKKTVSNDIILLVNKEQIGAIMVKRLKAKNKKHTKSVFYIVLSHFYRFPLYV